MKSARSVSIVSCMLLVLGSFSFCVLCGGEAAAQTKTMQIGLISSVTGPMAPAFKSELVAATPAAELINQKGGITVNGQKYNIEMVTADDVQRVAQTFFDQKHVALTVLGNLDGFKIVREDLAC